MLTKETKNNVNNTEGLITCAELARRLRVRIQDIYIMCDEGKIPFYELPPVRGKGLRVRRLFNYDEVKNHLLNKAYRRN